MHRRIRNFAGVVALGALLLSLAEGSWSSWCPDAAEDEAMAGMQHAGAAAHDPAGGGEAAPDPADCPIFALTGTCAGAAQLPATLALLRIAPATPHQAAAVAEPAHGLLFASGLFRPPRV